MPPKYVLKSIERLSTASFTRIYFDKNQLISDVIENWGKADLIVQQYVI